MLKQINLAQINSDTASAIAWWCAVWKWFEREHMPFASRYRCQVLIWIDRENVKIHIIFALCAWQIKFHIEPKRYDSWLLTFHFSSEHNLFFFLIKLDHNGYHVGKYR